MIRNVVCSVLHLVFVCLASGLLGSMGITINNWQFYVILCSLIGCYVCGQIMDSPFQESKQCDLLKEDIRENNDHNIIPNKEAVWEDTGIIVAAKYRMGAKVGDVFTLSPEEVNWVEEKIIRQCGKRAKIKEIQGDKMVCHLVWNLTETKRE